MQNNFQSPSLAAPDLQVAMDEIAAIEAELNSKRQVVRAAALAECKRIMSAFGISAEELSAPVKTVARAKYRGPNGETWTGRGRQPTWLTEQIEAGASREDFLID